MSLGTVEFELDNEKQTLPGVLNYGWVFVDYERTAQNFPKGFLKNLRPLADAEKSFLKKSNFLASSKLRIN